MRPVRRSVFTQLGRRLRSPKSVRILFRISDHPTSTVDRTRPWMTRPLLVSGPDYYKTLRYIDFGNQHFEGALNNISCIFF
ncbi:hypothetical protein ACOSQ3_011272 [Xanthoceras sorbifolium]